MVLKSRADGAGVTIFALGEYISFGISVWDLRTGTNPILFIPDVSTDGKAVVNLAIRCTLGRLDSDQLMDVVEDFLC